MNFETLRKYLRETSIELSPQSNPFFNKSAGDASISSKGGSFNQDSLKNASESQLLKILKNQQEVE
jgi:hypothetical protein